MMHFVDFAWSMRQSFHAIFLPGGSTMKIGTLLLMIFGLAGAALAQDSTSSGNVMHTEAGLERESASATLAMPSPATQGDVTYLCGGIGADETAYMKREAKGYDLMLEFAARDGAYLADVDVDIRDARGDTVLQTACDSPILLVALPRSGNYRVRAETAGYKLRETVKVTAAKGNRPQVAAAVLSWPQRIAEAPAAATTSTGSSGGDR
jgi:hypothetical protein